DLDNDGTIEGSATEDDYVILQAMDNTSVSTGQLTHTGNPYYFTGRRVDVLDGGDKILQYSRNRMLDYETGRWLSHDPLGTVGGLNLYGYIRGRVIATSDPYGLLECDCSEKDCKGLKPINDNLNEEVNDRLKWKNGSNKCPYCAVDVLGRELPHDHSNGMEAIQGWIQDQEDFRTSKGNYLPVGGYKWASCISMKCHGKKTCIGADKIGHFMQLGFMMWEIKKEKDELYARLFSLLTEGITKDDTPDGYVPGAIYSMEYLEALNEWLEDGEFDFNLYPDSDIEDFHNIWGGRLGLESSVGDAWANMYGMKFWDAYADWFDELQQGPMPDEFKFDICDYIDDINNLVEDLPGEQSEIDAIDAQVEMAPYWIIRTGGAGFF
ncbi:MAG: hypothetical protein JEZ07_19490, partial [Phycisphaerae bacterium]|nr:hypothetical protein [Phycisphaerae bacterium]